MNVLNPFGLNLLLWRPKSRLSSVALVLTALLISLFYGLAKLAFFVAKVAVVTLTALLVYSAFVEYDLFNLVIHG